MNILISGASGFMGKVVAELVKEYGHTPAAGVDKVSCDLGYPIYPTFAEVKEKCDCIIDFSHPSLLQDIIDYAVKTKTPAVIATTGISDEQIKLLEEASEQVPIFFSYNMSFGVNLLAELAKKAAALLYDTFDIEIVEKHHNRKLDAPSGTAIMLANAISESLPEEPIYIYDRHNRREKRNKREIGISSIRGGTIVGEHDIIFAGKDEIVTLSHSALSREIFAVGAVKAALFIALKEKGMYSMKDMVSGL